MLEESERKPIRRKYQIQMLNGGSKMSYKNKNKNKKLADVDEQCKPMSTTHIHTFPDTHTHTHTHSSTFFLGKSEQHVAKHH